GVVVGWRLWRWQPWCRWCRLWEGNEVRMVVRWMGVAADVVTVVVVVARGGEWCGGSDRSGDGESFWVRRNRSPKNFFSSGGWWPTAAASTIIHSESTSKHDVSASSKARADSGMSAPKDPIPQTTCNDEGPNKLSLDHILAETPSISVGKSLGLGLISARLEAYDGEINLGVAESMILNELEAYDGEINLGVAESMILNEYAVKLCLEHEVKRGNKIVKKELIVALKEINIFLEDIKDEEKSMDDWDQLPDFNLDDIPLLGGEKLLPFRYLTQEEAAKEALEDEEATKKVKGEVLKEKDDPRAFIGTALADIGSDINTMPYRIYETLGREEMKKVDIGITMINHTQAEAIRIFINVLCQMGVTTIIAKFLILDIPIDHDALIVVWCRFWAIHGASNLFLLITYSSSSSLSLNAVLRTSDHAAQK
nr:hypothetical protein [Tanacetum cinerariifolium]